jgi:hypothetical protein
MKLVKILELTVNKPPRSAIALEREKLNAQAPTGRGQVRYRRQ